MGSNTIFMQQQENQFRCGKWTDEEEAYAVALMEAFKDGLLEDIEQGASLRLYLSTKLHCNVKRVSKKYEGTNYQGARRFQKNASASPEELAFTRSKLVKLHEDFEASIKVLAMVRASKTAAASHGTSAEIGTAQASTQFLSSGVTQPSAMLGAFPNTSTQATLASLEDALGFRNSILSTQHDPLRVQSLLGRASVRSQLFLSHLQNSTPHHQTLLLEQQLPPRRYLDPVVADRTSILGSDSMTPASTSMFMGGDLLGAGLGSRNLRHERSTMEADPVAAAAAARRTYASLWAPSADSPAATSTSALGVMPTSQELALLMQEEERVAAVLSAGSQTAAGARRTPASRWAPSAESHAAASTSAMPTSQELALLRQEEERVAVLSAIDSPSPQTSLSMIMVRTRQTPSETKRRWTAQQQANEELQRAQALNESLKKELEREEHLYLEHQRKRAKLSGARPGNSYADSATRGFC
ncbi:expressed unknown protein [Seminavis robusta]|uniref:Uncharacterized protein n=1 Tax=Seminavis robusta TaxID=568900 RepID=A0A9N8EXT2_9STRA|nr:expressed unknown protein [Seminavis robusta]|eukprot:Sro2384_g325680.1 n/a (471) ;mRNA; f:2239-3651